MSFLFFLFILLLVVGLMIVAGAFNIVLSILRSIFSFGKKDNQQSRQKTYGSQQSQKSANRKRFNKDDAEDAVFEEIS